MESKCIRQKTEEVAPLFPIKISKDCTLGSQWDIWLNTHNRNIGKQSETEYYHLQMHKNVLKKY